MDLVIIIYSLRILFNYMGKWNQRTFGFLVFHDFNSVNGFVIDYQLMGLPLITYMEH